MKKIQIVNPKDLYQEGFTYIHNGLGYILQKPNQEAQEMLATGKWVIPSDNEIVTDYIKTHALPWKIQIHIPSYNNFNAMQGYTNFANQLENGLINYGIEFTSNLNQDTDLICIINSVWAGANTDQIKSLKERANGKPICMFTMFESDHWIDSHVQEMEHVDFLIVPCKWNRDTLIKQGFTKPVFVCPLPNNDNFNYLERPNKRDVFTFLQYNAGDFRKGFPEYLEAFQEEFSPDENVKFVMKSRENDPANTNLNRFDNIFKSGRIQWIIKNMTHGELEIIHQDSDCFVFPSKGEGWGYPPIEALLTGNPVIITKAHSFLDWFNKACLPVKTGLEPATFSIFGERQEGTGNWFKPRKEDIKKQMRFVFEEWKREGRQAPIFLEAKKQAGKIKERFSQKRVANLFIDILRQNKILE